MLMPPPLMLAPSCLSSGRLLLTSPLHLESASTRQLTVKATTVQRRQNIIEAQYIVVYAFQQMNSSASLQQQKTSNIYSVHRSEVFIIRTANRAHVHRTQYMLIEHSTNTTHAHRTQHIFIEHSTCSSNTAHAHRTQHMLIEHSTCSSNTARVQTQMTPRKSLIFQYYRTMQRWLLFPKLASYCVMILAQCHYQFQNTTSMCVP